MKQNKMIFWLSIFGVLLLFISVSMVKAAPGDLDSTFGNGGVVNLPGVDAQSVAFQSDGRIVVGGSIVVHGFSRFFVARYERNGALDQSFGTGGAAIFDVVGGYH